MSAAVWMLVFCIGSCLYPRMCEALDKQRRISQYAHTAWRLQDGYLSGTPTAIAQTKDGYIWVGTQNSLVRFDGIRFVTWEAPNGARLPSSGINALAAASDGGLWIGTTSGLARWTGSKLVNFKPGGRVNQIISDSRGDIWISRSRTNDTLGPLCQVIIEKLICHGKSEGVLAPNGGPLISDPNGDLWFGATDSLVRWSHGAAQVHPIPWLGTAHGLSGVEALAVSDDHSMWVGVDRSGTRLGLQHFANGAFTSVRGPTFDGSSWKVIALFRDRDGVLWVGTLDDGIFRVDGENIDHFGSADGLSGDVINAFAQDREGNIWVATTKGIDNFRDLPVATFSKQQGLSTDEAASVVAGPDGRLWIGNLKSLDTFQTRSVSPIRSVKGLPGQQVTSLLIDHSGGLWVGVDNGLFRFIEGRFIPVLRDNGQPTGFVKSLAEDKERNVWAETGAGKDAGLLRISNGRVQQVWDNNGHPAHAEVFRGPRGNIWLGVYPGSLAQFQAGKITTFAIEDQNDFGSLRSPFTDQDDDVWASSQRGEVYFHGGKFNVLTESNGLPCRDIYASIKDRHGALWMYAQCGLMRIDSKEIKHWTSDPKTRIATQTFDIYAGAQPSLATFAPMTTRSPDGKLWFVNDNVLQVVDPDHLQLNPLSPPVHIEDLIANQQVYQVGDKLVLPRDTKDLQIDYTALSFVNPQRVRFRVRLIGHDTVWRDVDNRRSAFYTNLRPGKYKFLVIACNSEGVWNTVGAALDFSITPAWYQMRWFQTLCGFAGLLLCYLLYLGRLRQHSARLRIRFEERLEERTRIARDLHDTLLQTIQGTKLIADVAEENASDPSKIKQSLKTLSEWLSRATIEGRAALESLRAADATDLATALHSVIGDYSATSELRVSLLVEGPAKEMDPVVRDEVYRIGYEAIRNAYNHSQGSHISVELATGKDLILQVKDDGRGIPEPTLVHGKSGHYGLTGMRERASQIGAILNISSSRQHGTTVRLSVPGELIFQSAKKLGCFHLRFGDESYPVFAAGTNANKPFHAVRERGRVLAREDRSSLPP